MAVTFPQLGAGYSIRGVTIRNRIALAPILVGGARGGRAGAGHVEHYGRIADGGTGLIIVEVAAVCPTGMTHSGQIGLWSEDCARALAPVADRVRSAGAVCLVQLSHGGPRSPSAVTGQQPIAASPVDNVGPDPSRTATADEAEQVVQWFTDAAGFAQMAGCAGVEIHAAHFYFVSSFLSGFTNLRSDRYGGEAANRARILLDIVRGIRDRCGDEFIICIRLNGVELLPGGLTVEEAGEIARLAGTAGADLIHVSAYAAPVAPTWNNLLTVGSTPGQDSPPGPFLGYAAEIRRRCGLPVIGVGKILEPELAERALADGMADFVALGRGLLRDPKWANKALAGRVDEIKRCTTCQLCHGSLGKSFVLCPVREREERD